MYVEKDTPEENILVMVILDCVVIDRDLTRFLPYLGTYLCSWIEETIILDPDELLLVEVPHNK